MTKPRACRPKKSHGDAAQPQSKSLCLLVVENHPSTRRGLEVFLDMLGHRAHYAEDVQSALAEAATGQYFDVLLSDISLPDGDGWELLHELRLRGQCPPFAIAMSGFGSNVDLEKSRAAGFRKHLVKPFPPEELEAVLKLVRPKQAA